MIYILHHRFFLILLFLTASGCATLSNPTFEAQVETTHAWSKTHQSTINRTFEIEPISSIQIATSASSSNEINILLSETISGMERQGFDLASSSAPPNYWVSVEYSQERVVRHKSSYQPYPYVNYGSNRELLGIFLVSSLLAATQSRQEPTQEFYQNRLTFMIRTQPNEHASSADIVYQAHVMSESTSPTIEKLLPWLILSVFEEFPKESGTKKLVKIPYNTNRYFSK